MFHARWKIPEFGAAYLGDFGGVIFSAEYAEHGSTAYKNSLILPLRNAYYSACCIERRWADLQKLDLPEPILDYGCGVGFMLRWLAELGFQQLYGFELDGVQKRVTKEYLESHGVLHWEGEPPTFGTVLCFNVLEHLEEPLKTLEWLRTLSPNVIANCALDLDKPQHAAPVGELEKVLESLHEHGEAFQCATSTGTISAS